MASINQLQENLRETRVNQGIFRVMVAGATIGTLIFNISEFCSGNPNFGTFAADAAIGFAALSLVPAIIESNKQRFHAENELAKAEIANRSMDS